MAAVAQGGKYQIRTLSRRTGPLASQRRRIIRCGVGCVCATGQRWVESGSVFAGIGAKQDWRNRCDAVCSYALKMTSLPFLA